MDPVSEFSVIGNQFNSNPQSAIGVFGNRESGWRGGKKIAKKRRVDNPSSGIEKSPILC
jgi:hypothetical protein